MMKNGKKKKKKKNGMTHGMKAIGPTTKTGMMAIGPKKNCTTRMSMVISRRKAKERKAGKERKATMMKVKEVNQEMEKASQTMFSLKLHPILPFRINNNNNNNNNKNKNKNKNSRLITLLQPQVLDMVLFHFVNQAQHDCISEQGNRQEVSCLGWRS